MWAFRRTCLFIEHLVDLLSILKVVSERRNVLERTDVVLTIFHLNLYRDTLSVVSKVIAGTSVLA